MPDTHKLQKLADIIINYSVALQKGEKLLIRGYGFEGYPLIKELYREAVQKGARKVDVRFSVGELGRIFYDHATAYQLAYRDRIDEKVAETYDAMIQIVADENPYELSNVPVSKIQTVQKASKPLSDILHKKRWLLFYYPARAYAQTAKKSQETWEDFVLDSCIRDWKKEEQVQKRFIELMKKIDEVHVTGNETDLKLSVKGQAWRTCCGRCNLPDGEIFTSPRLISVSGVIRFNVPTRYQSKDFEWVKLWFEKGVVVKEEASHHTEDVTAILDADQGGRRVGEFAFGLNKTINEPTRMILYDEKMGNSLHMALGKCYDDAPNGNDSTIHWDMILRFDWAGAGIFFDGVKVYEKKKWVDQRFRFLN